MPPQSVTGTAFLLFYVDVRTSQETHASTVCYRDGFTSFYVDSITSHETHASTVRYRDSFTSFYVDVRTSQETHASTVCYRDSFPSFLCKCSYLTGDTCLHSLLPEQLSFFYVQMFVPHRRHMHPCVPLFSLHAPHEPKLAVSLQAAH
jgi:hypothetical protein